MKAAKKEIWGWTAATLAVLAVFCTWRPELGRKGQALIVLAGGALAMNIAGSGPSVFALASNYEAAVRISGEMKRHFEGLGIGCNSYAGRVSNAGARVVE